MPPKKTMKIFGYYYLNACSISVLPILGKSVNLLIWLGLNDFYYVFIKLFCQSPIKWPLPKTPPSRKLSGFFSFI